MATESHDTTERVVDLDRALAPAGGSGSVMRAESPLTRNRALRILGGALFGTAVAVVSRSVPAQAYHGSWPYPCYGYNECHCCNGRYCCESGCHGHTNLGCRDPYNEPSQCWSKCASNGRYYRCCDWHDAAHNPCICSGNIREC